MFFNRGIVLSTEQSCRLSQPCVVGRSNVDRSIVSSTRALLEGVPVALNPQKNILVSTGALFHRHQHCFVDRSIVLAAEALFGPSLARALLEGVPVAMNSQRSIVVSTGALFCRHQQCFVDRSIVLAAEALFCHSLTGALFCWQEHCFVDRSLVMSTGAMLCRPEHSDRSMPQEHCGFGGSTVLSQSGRSIVVAVGA